MYYKCFIKLIFYVLCCKAITFKLINIILKVIILPFIKIIIKLYLKFTYNLHIFNSNIVNYFSKLMYIIKRKN